MRVSSVGWLCSSLNDVLKLAALTASVTHNSTEGIKGAQAIASCVFIARSGMDKTEIRQACVNLFGYDLSRTLDEIRPSYTFDVSCQGSVPEAIIILAEYLRELRTAEFRKIMIVETGNNIHPVCVFFFCIENIPSFSHY